MMPRYVTILVPLHVELPAWLHLRLGAGTVASRRIMGAVPSAAAALLSLLSPSTGKPVAIVIASATNSIDVGERWAFGGDNAPERATTYPNRCSMASLDVAHGPA